MGTRAALIVTIVAVLGLAGCGDAGGANGGGRLQVMASFYPLFEATRAVGGDRVEVFNLTAAGVEPHDVELSTRQVDAIEDADVVLFLGRGFQPAVEEAAERAKAAVDLLTGNDIDGDPHVWLDPVRMIRLVEGIQAALTDKDPSHTDAYAANAKSFIDGLRALDGDFQNGLKTCARRRIVTSHAAFGYLADRYGLEQDAIAGLAPESEPNPRRLAQLADQVKAEGTTTIFYETLVSPRVAEALAREARVTTAVLNPLEGLTTDEVAAGANYDTVMRANLQALRSALGCT